MQFSFFKLMYIEFKTLDVDNDPLIKYARNLMLFMRELIADMSEDQVKDLVEWLWAAGIIEYKHVTAYKDIHVINKTSFDESVIDSCDPYYS